MKIFMRAARRVWGCAYVQARHSRSRGCATRELIMQKFVASPQFQYSFKPPTADPARRIKSWHWPRSGDFGLSLPPKSDSFSPQLNFDSHRVTVLRATFLHPSWSPAELGGWWFDELRTVTKFLFLKLMLSAGFKSFFFFHFNVIARSPSVQKTFIACNLQNDSKCLLAHGNLSGVQVHNTLFIHPESSNGQSFYRAEFVVCQKYRERR